MRRYCEISVGEFESGRAGALAAKIKRSPLFAQLLLNRGIDTPAKYMKWSLDCASSLYSPASLPDIDRAVDLLEEAQRLDQLVFVCGDYDADGICATAIMVRALRSLNIQTEYELPSRIQEGYGVNRREIDRAAELGASLLITVDCGSSNPEEVEYARSLGLKVIVTDHHQVPENYPAAEAFVNPQRSDSLYPEKNLCGAAVAWKVIAALYTRLKLPAPMDLLDFAGFATVTDMMPLTGENRVLCRLGLTSIASWRRPCLRALGEAAGVRGRTFNAKTISYYLGPRINAVGRVDDARRGSELMLCDNAMECQKLAAFIEECNLRRRQLQNSVVDSVKARLDLAAARRQGFIMEYGDWHFGVVGIAAGMLSSDYRLPCLVGRREGEYIMGSGRSPLGTDLHAAMTECVQLLERFGGHPSAVGFALRFENLEAFKERLAAVLPKHRRPIPPSFVDFEMRLDELDVNFIGELKELEPTGQGAPSPCFLFRNVRFTDLRALKEGRYIGGSLMHRGGSAKIKMLAFGCADDLRSHGLLDQVCDVVGSLDISSFGGVDKPCVNIDYAVAADVKQLQGLDRNDGSERAAKDYTKADFVPVPPCRQLPIAIALPEEQRQKLLAEYAGGNVGSPVPDAKTEARQEAPVCHYLLDHRGADPLEYVRGVIANLQSRRAKCGPDRLGLIIAFENMESRLPAELARLVTVLTWKQWLALDPVPKFSDVLFVSPPLDLPRLRQGDLLQSVSRLHLVYSEDAWEEIARYVEKWMLSRTDLDRVWLRLKQWLSNHGGTYSFARGDKQLSAVCDMYNAKQLRMTEQIAGELRLLDWEKSAEGDIISLAADCSAGSEGIDWSKSPSFARMERWRKGFKDSRGALERKRAELQMFWPE